MMRKDNFLGAPEKGILIEIMSLQICKRSRKQMCIHPMVYVLKEETVVKVFSIKRLSVKELGHEIGVEG